MIGTDDVYVLTLLGDSELAAAGTSLSRSELELLVLIDGKATVSQVQASARNLAPSAVLEALKKLLRSGHIAWQGIDLGDFFGASAPPCTSKTDMPSDSAIARGVSTLQQDGYIVRIARRPQIERKLEQNRKLMVMVVEDEQYVAKNMCTVLTRAGFSARLAANREQIVAAFRHPPLPDLVLLDVMLPDTDGYEVLAKMRQHRTIAEIPVIMVTGAATREAVLKGLLGDANGYITKPFKIDVLIKAVKAVLGIDASDQEAILGSTFGAAKSARPGGEIVPDALPSATPNAAPTPSAREGSSRLAKFKQLSLTKQSEEKTSKAASQQEIDARVGGAVERAFLYLKEFTEHLNIVKPAYAKEYSIVGVPKFEGLLWDGSQIDFRTRESSPMTRVYEQLTLHFRLSANKQLRATRDIPADEKLKQALLDAKIKFATQEERNERGSLVRRTFVLPCKVEAALQLIGNFDTGKLLLSTHNIGHFGTLEHVLATEAITEESLDELTGFILGESNRIGPLLLKNP